MKIPGLLFAMLSIAALQSAPLLAQDASDRARIDAIARDAARKFEETRTSARNDQTRPSAATPPAPSVVELPLDDVV